MKKIGNFTTPYKYKHKVGAFCFLFFTIKIFLRDIKSVFIRLIKFLIHRFFVS